MGKQVVYYTFGAVVVYLLVSKATDAGKLFTSGAQAYGTAVKALQGR